MTQENYVVLGGKKMTVTELYEKLSSPKTTKALADAIDNYGEISKQDRLSLLRYAKSLPDFKKFWED